jgi:DNA polymerase III epsilon subunit-like protein
MARPWTEQLIHFIDFEGSLGSGVLEFGVVTLRGAAIEQVRTGLCAPTGYIPDEDIALHGLAPADLAGRLPFTSEWEYFAGLRRSGPLAAHYAGVENSLIKQVWPYARSSPDFIHLGRQTVEWGPWIDSARIYAQMRPPLGSLRLQTLIESFCLQPELDRLATRHCPPERHFYHAALYDALASALLVRSLAGDSAYAQQTLGHLILRSTSDPVKREAIIQPELW